MPIKAVNYFVVICDEDECGLYLDYDDVTSVYDDELAATIDARECGWQVTTAGVFCPDHVRDVVPLDQPGPTLLDPTN